jgi:cobalt-zinc-cadmium efflux system outer membrane protein
MWGAFEPDFDAVQSALFNLEAVPDFASLDRRIENNPSIALLATQQRLARARLALDEARARPDPELSAGLRHLNEYDDIGMVLSLRVPLGTARRAAPFVDEARANAVSEELQARHRQLALRTTLSSLYQEMLHARDRFEVYRDSIIPAAEQALQDYSAGYAVGRYSLLELTAARETLLEARLESLSSVVDHHSTHIEIDRLVGTAPLDGTPAKGVYK